MNLDDIQLLFEYDRWANQRVLQAASALSVEQFTRDLSGSFRSIRDTLLHIIGGEWGWLAYWKEPSQSPAFLADLWNRHDALFRPDAFPNVDAVRLKWVEIEREQTEFVNRLTDEALRKMLPVRKTHLSLAHLMQHLANHSSYHRGQIAAMMRQVGAQPLATDFHVFLVEGGNNARSW
ncbi:MAG TPA: DinB family protein [Candidatus Acidoferrum sp.]|nr:DinB family protein [Candidatus Acidoferrum sp.]